MQDQAFRLRLQVAVKPRTVTYNPTTGKVWLYSADKSDTVPFAKNAVLKELGDNRAGAGARSRRCLAPYPPNRWHDSSAHLKENYALLKKLSLRDLDYDT